MKLYFESKDSEYCVTYNDLQDIMLENNLTEIKVLRAKIDLHTDHFWCAEFGTVGEVGEGCGSDCKEYKPRNGKNGRCRFSKNCYMPAEEVAVKLKKDRKKTNG
jgi:hypothetical protein